MTANSWNSKVPYVGGDLARSDTGAIMAAFDAALGYDPAPGMKSVPAFEPPHVMPAVLPWWICSLSQWKHDKADVFFDNRTWVLWDPADGGDMRLEKSLRAFRSLAADDEFAVEVWNGTVAWHDLVRERHYAGRFDRKALCDGWPEVDARLGFQDEPGNKARIALMMRAAHWAEIGRGAHEREAESC